MIIREFYRIRTDGVNLYRTYSDQGFQIHKIGTDEIYDEAVDIETAPYQYAEIDTKIDGDFNDSDISDAEFRALVEEAL